jgi:hypothetical protein
MNSTLTPGLSAIEVDEGHYWADRIVLNRRLERALVLQDRADAELPRNATQADLREKESASPRAVPLRISTPRLVRHDRRNTCRR